MKVREIFLTPENVLSYQSEDVHSRVGAEHLRLHMDLNSALNEATSASIDSGSQYAAWLNNIGICHQTESGWWNQTAVDKENMQAFVDYWHGDAGDTLVDAYLELKEKIQSLPKNIRIEMIDRHINVREFIGV